MNDYMAFRVELIVCFSNESSRLEYSAHLGRRFKKISHQQRSNWLLRGQRLNFSNDNWLIFFFFFRFSSELIFYFHKFWYRVKGGSLSWGNIVLLKSKFEHLCLVFEAIFRKLKKFTSIFWTCFGNRFFYFFKWLVWRNVNFHVFHFKGRISKYAIFKLCFV